MQETDDKETPKHPVDMTTEEAIDYCFSPEIADELRKQVRDENGDSESEEDVND